jgi:N-acyl homoserine lactone hydrolase
MPSRKQETAMSSCIVYPMPLLEFELDKSRMTNAFNLGQPTALIVYAWYIEGAGDRILVDAGPSVEYYSKVRRIPAREIQSLESGLGELGTGLGDIDLVVATHLHHDHIAQARKLPKAKVMVQRAELEFARNPHPLFVPLYSAEFFEGLDFEVVAGDVEVCEGVSLLATPGHSPGGQAVSVRTAKGVVVIAGLCSIRENFEPPPPIKEGLPVIPPGIHTDVRIAYDSTLRIKEAADIVLPLHEPELRLARSIG